MCKLNFTLLNNTKSLSQTNNLNKKNTVILIETKISHANIICLFKKLLFTMENATAADSSQSNVSRVYI